VPISNWIIKEENELTDNTKIKEADNKIQASIDDLTLWVNSEDEYETTGLMSGVDEVLTGVQSDWDSTKVLWYDEWNTELQAIVEETIVQEW
jgi:hypothetical protein